MNSWEKLMEIFVKNEGVSFRYGKQYAEIESMSTEITKRGVQHTIVVRLENGAAEYILVNEDLYYNFNGSETKIGIVYNQGLEVLHNFSWAIGHPAIVQLLHMISSVERVLKIFKDNDGTVWVTNKCDPLLQLDSDLFPHLGIGESVRIR